MKPNEVELPIWMQKLPKEKRGYPVPFIALRDTDGNPHFTVTDETVRQHVIKKDLCAICGRKLLRWRALVGGPQAALMPTGAYLDPPMHIECATYALKVCPFLAAPSYSKRLEDRKLDPDKREGIVVAIDENVKPEQPKVYLMVVHLQCDYVMYEGSRVVMYVKPRKPYVRIEYWRHGVKLDQKTGEALVNEVLADLIKEELSKQYARTKEAGN